MLEKPGIEDDRIIRCLKENFGLHAGQLTFLPIGADVNTAVYRARTEDGKDWFVKLRRGDFPAASVLVPQYLKEQGLREVIAPIPAPDGSLWADLAPYKLILFPFIEGRDGFEQSLSDAEWEAFGAALRRFHDTRFPAEICAGVPREDFSPRWREEVKEFLERIHRDKWTDPSAVGLATFLRGKESETLALVERCEGLVQEMHRKSTDFVLCHGDIHAWNLLVQDEHIFFIVDWDTLLFAPRERDLMFIGAGLGGRGPSPEEEESLFYRGYGAVSIDADALLYYRLERVIEDIAAYCEQLFLSDEGGDDREQALLNVKSNFEPGGTIELAFRTKTV